jgi:HPr kinase/phosphorylase
MDVGVLLRGPSGSGKSDAALRLVDAGALLVADDQVDVRMNGAGLVASAPARLAGLLEVRGVGIVPLPALRESSVDLVIDLTAAVERLPEPRTVRLLDADVPVLALAPFESSFVPKVKAAAAQVAAGRLCKTPDEP